MIRSAGILIAALAVAVSAVFGGAFYGSHLMLVALALSIAIGLGCVSGQSYLRSDEWMIAAVMLWAAASALVLSDAPLAAKVTITTWLTAWCVWVGARRASRQTAERAILVLIAASVVIAGLIVTAAVAERKIRQNGPFDSHNVAGAVLVSIVPLVLYSDRLRRWKWPVVALLTAAIVITGSRAAWIAGIAVIVSGLPRGRLRSAVGWLGSAAAVLAVMLRALFWPEPLAWFRLKIWKALIKLAVEHPLAGVGPGELAEAAGVIRIYHDGGFAHYDRIISYSESSFVAIPVQLGGIGALLFLIGAIALVRDVRSRGLFEDPQVRSVTAGILAYSVFHDVLTIPILLWWWGLVAGFVYSDDVLKEATRCGRSFERIVLGAALGGLVVWGLATPALADRIWNGPRPNAEIVEQVIRVEPLYTQAPVGRVQELLRQKVWDWETAAEAIHWASYTAAWRSGDAKSWGLLAQAQARTALELGAGPHSIAAARSAYREARTREPYLPWYWYAAAQLERALGDLQTARSYVTRAVELEPNYVRGNLLVARLELDLGRVHAARSALERVHAILERAESRDLRSSYETELAACPSWQLRQLEDVLQ